MKRKPQLKIESHLPKGWWKHPTFDFGIHYPMPYIWFAYWLITWEEEEDHPFDNFQYKYIRFNWKAKRFYKMFLNWRIFHFIRVSISFMPD